MPSTQDTHSHEMKNIMYVEKLAERHPVHTHSYETSRIHIQRHPMHTLSHETFQTYRDTQNTHMKCFIHIQRRPIHSHETFPDPNTETPNTLT